MYIELSFPFFLFLCALGWALAGSAPTSMAYREALHEQREATRIQRARARAQRRAARTARQAWRRRIFGSHPVLYGALAWASPVLVMSLLALYGAR